MLSLRYTTAVRAPAAPRRASRRPVAPVRAFLGLDQIGDAFVRIFSPPKDQAPNGNWSGTSSPFTGRIDHHGRGRPFKDGFSGSKAAPKAPKAAMAEAQTAAEETMDKAEGYMDGAIQNLMGRNFAGKEDEEKPTTGAEGWKGDLHGRNRDGFHLPRK